MPPKRLYEQIRDRCLPPGTLGHDACHARDAEEIARLTRERDEARAEVKHWRDAWAEAQVKLDTRPDVEAERDRLRALLREWRHHLDGHGLGVKHGRTLLDRTDAALEGRDG